MKRLFTIFSLALAISASASKIAHAQSDEEYFSRLQAMQSALRSQKIHDLIAPGPGNTEGTLVKLGLQKNFFKVGQAWTVEVHHKSDSRGRMPVPSATTVPAAAEAPILYDFKVLGFDSLKRARLEVRERSTGENVKVDFMILTVTDQFVVAAKEIHYSDGRSARIIEFGGEANVALGFERYPIDLPDLQTAVAEPMREPPPTVRAYLALAPGRILDLHFDDLFARPIRALWAEGDVWPLYFENTAFTAIVIKRGATP